MCLFNKLKPQAVYDFLDNAWKNVELPELPAKRDRNYDTFRPSPYNSVDKGSSYYNMELCGRWNIYYQSYYHKKDKEIYFSIQYFNLTVTNPDTQKALKETYKDYTISFLGSVCITTKHFPAKTIKDVEAAFSNFIETWRKSGLYQIFDKFETNEEHKNKK